MTFNKCSIRGKLYGYVIDENGNEIQDTDVIYFRNDFNNFFFFKEIRKNRIN